MRVYQQVDQEVGLRGVCVGPRQAHEDGVATRKQLRPLWHDADLQKLVQRLWCRVSGLALGQPSASR